MNIFSTRIGIIIPLFFTIASSWLLIHLMAFLGFFLAAAYPLWWLLNPRKTPCLSCRVIKDGKYCYFCRKVVDKQTDPSPSGLLSAMFNGLFIIFFSALSAGVVYVEILILNYFGFPPTPQTVSFVIPTTGQYRLGEIFPLKIEIVGIRTAVNAVQADIGFEKDNLEVVEVSTEGSFANIFIQKEINNDTGFVRLTGGLPNPGFQGDKGLFGTVFFKGKTPGVVQIKFLPSSMALANDGRGTNVLKDLTKVSYLILPERISLEEESLQQKFNFQVLGTSTSQGQMIFYKEEQVRGVSTTIKEIDEKAKNFLYPLSAIFEILEKIDRYLLGFWLNLFDPTR